MPGVTTGGYPYAEPTDPLVQWPATSQSLAEKIDAQVTLAMGKTVGGSRDFSPAGEMAAGSVYTYNVPFPAGMFTAAPFVNATYRPFTGAMPDGYLSPEALGAAACHAFPIISGVTETGFRLTLVAVKLLSTPGSVQWLALSRD